MSRVVLVRRVDKLIWRERSATLLALVAVSPFGSASRTGAHDIAVGKELPRNLIAELLLGLLYQLALVIERAEEVGSELVVNLRSSAAVDIKRNTELLKGFLDQVMVAVNHLLYGDTLLACTDSNGHAVLVATANKHHLLFLQSQVAHVDIGRHIDTGKVPDVHTTVGIRQGSRNCGTLEMLFFHIYSCILYFKMYKTLFNCKVNIFFAFIIKISAIMFVSHYTIR